MYVVIWYISPVLVCLDKEKSGKPALEIQSWSQSYDRCIFNHKTGVHGEPLWLSGKVME
jgi:hypothetical protein